jgi:hypothetical protein
MPTASLEPIDRRLARLQRAMGLSADGILGPATMTALEARILSPQQIANVPCSLEVSRAGLDLLVSFEVTSPAYYEKKLRRPCWPGGESGVTIGIGYDVGVTSARQIEQDWRGQLTDAAVDRLLTVQGVTGARARQLAGGLSDVGVPFDIAQTVFYRCTVPQFARRTLGVYPGVDELPPDAQAMILSLI